MGTVSASKIRWGYGVDGAALYVPVTLPADEIICPECEGTGRIHCTNARNGFEYRSTEICDRCDGDGVLAIEIEERE